MYPLSNPRISLPLIGFASLFLFGVSDAAADRYTGVGTMRGVIVVRGRTTDLAANLRARNLRSPSSRLLVNWNAAGLWSQDKDQVFTSYRGRLRTVSNKNGTVRRTVSRRPVVVSRRFIRFPHAPRIRLNRPLRIDGNGRYRIRGRGRVIIGA